MESERGGAPIAWDEQLYQGRSEQQVASTEKALAVTWVCGLALLIAWGLFEVSKLIVGLFQ